MSSNASESPVAPGAPEPRARRGEGPQLRVLGVPLIFLLAAQLLLGTALNLFGSLPSGSPLKILESSPILLLHVVVGVLLVGLSSRILTLGLRLRDRRSSAVGALAVLSALVAFLAGVAFTFGGGGTFASYLMSVGFTGVLVGGALLLVPRSPVELQGAARYERAEGNLPALGGGT
ncbi:MAG: hypothetical protein L3K13_05380 [Thermoplasmata archaeon]|nr:hypothetical protein [Thermoplasmata archaeon]